MRSSAQLVFYLLLPLVEVHTQTAAYVSFRGVPLPNHGYVDLSEVGDPEDGGDSVQCHTDLSNCCSMTESLIHDGDWYFPNASRVLFSRHGGDIYQRREAQRVELRRRNNATSSGVYRCEIAVFDDTLTRDKVYVGLYATGGNVTIDSFSVEEDNNDTGTQFTLTCISTGGPATNVTWTRDSVTVTEGTETVLANQVSSQYIHTLNVNGSAEGFYTLTVANNKPSTASLNLFLSVAPPGQPSIATGNATATSISLSWTGAGSDGASYEVMWQRDTSLECPDDDDGNFTIVTTTNYDIVGLQEDSRYNITVKESINNTFNHTVSVMTPEAAPSAPPISVSVSASAVTPSNVSVQWGTVPCIHRNGLITGYAVRYGAQEITVMGTEVTITNTQSHDAFFVQVAAVNKAGIGIFSHRQYLVEVPVLSAGTTTATSISLSWTSANSENVSYEVIWQRDTSLECPREDNGNITITNGSTSYAIMKLEEGSTYNITVTAFNAEGSSAVGDTVSAVTMEAAPSAAPSSVSVTAVSPSSLNVQWEMVPCICRNGNITGYLVKYTGGGSTQTMSVSGSSTTEVNITGLSPSTSYDVQMAAVNDAGTGVFSDSQSVMTKDSELSIPQDIAFDLKSDLQVPTPQFTLTCISTGGPATTVTWTRDSVTLTEGAETVLDDPVTAQYTHTLTVTGRLGGLYTCTVANNPFTASKGLYVEVALAPTNLSEVQESVSGVRVSWSPPSPLGKTTGYQIYYSSSNISGSISISSGSVDNYLVSLVDSGTSHNGTFSIIGTSSHLPSKEQTIVIGSHRYTQSATMGNSCNDIGMSVGIAVAVAVGLILAVSSVVLLTVCIVKCKRQRLRKFSLNPQELYTVENPMTTSANIAYNTALSRKRMRETGFSQSYDIIDPLHMPSRPGQILLKDGGYEVDTPPNIRNARAQAHEETESETEQKDAQEESVYLEIPKQS